VLNTWTVRLRCSSDEVRRARALLSVTELERADAFLSPRARADFIVTRAALRGALAHCLGIEPRSVRLTTGLFGKPVLSKRRDLRFNLSHSAGLAVITVGHVWALGVDIERLPRDPVRGLAIAERFFAREEIDALLRLDTAALPSALATLWSRKEAYVKALGVGLRVPLSSFTVTVVGAPAVLRCVPGDPIPASSWRFTNLQLPRGIRGTVAAAGPTVVDHRPAASADERSRLALS
jgi:4'-phosphopantetheinyl transferase